MANCIIGHSDCVQETPLVTPAFGSDGDWETDQPLSNLADPELANAARSSSAAIADTRFRLDMGTDRQVRVIANPSHYGSVVAGLKPVSSVGYTRFLGVPSSLLFDYEAGDDIAARGGTFARADAATCATYIDRNGIRRTLAANVERDGNIIGGVRTMLLEMAGTNLVLQSEDFGTTWTTSGSPTRSAAAHTSSGVTLDLIGDDDAAAREYYAQAITFTGDAVKAVSIHVKQGSSTSSVIRLRDTTAGADRLLAAITWSGTTPVITMTTGTSYGYIAMDDGVYRILLATTSVTAANTNELQVNPATNAALSNASTGTIYAGGVQAENNSFPTSYIKTTTTTVTRAVDVLSYPIPTGMTTPAAMTLYVKFVERGTLLTADARVFEISEAGNNASAIFIRSTSGGFYEARVTDAGGSATSTSTLGVAPAIGDTVELCVTHSGAGAVQISQSINGAAFVPAAAGAAAGLPATWGSGTASIWIGGRNGANAAAAAYQSVRVASGVQTTSYMQSIVYDSGWINQYPSGGTAETLEGMNVPHVVIVPTTQTAFRYLSCQIDDTANANGYVDLARLFVGKGWDPTTNFSVGAQIGLESGTKRTDTDAFSPSFQVKSTRRTQRLVLEMMDLDEAMENGFDIQRLAGIDKDLFWITDSADTDHMYRRAFIGNLRQLSALEYPYALYHRMAFEVVERL